MDIGVFWGASTGGVAAGIGRTLLALGMLKGVACLRRALKVENRANAGVHVGSGVVLLRIKFKNMLTETSGSVLGHNSVTGPGSAQTEFHPAKMMSGESGHNLKGFVGRNDHLRLGRGKSVCRGDLEGASTGVISANLIPVGRKLVNAALTAKDVAVIAVYVAKAPEGRV
jgi:hypothetical protein